MEASNNNYANVEPIAQLRLANGSLGYRSCLIVHSRLGHLRARGHGGEDVRLQRSQLDLRLPGAVHVLHDRDGHRPEEHFSKVTFSGSHEASILAVANKKVEVASTNLPDLQQLTRENKVPRGGLRVIWVSKLIPNDPIVVRKDLPASLRSAIQESLVSMRTGNAGGLQGDRRLAGRLRAGRRREVPGDPRAERRGQEAGGAEVAEGPVDRRRRWMSVLATAAPGEPRGGLGAAARAAGLPAACGGPRSGS